MKRAIAIVALISTLSGCVAAFVAGAAAGGLVVYDRRSIAQINLDNTMRHRINKSLVHNSVFRNSHIVVAVFNRVVLLVGQTPHASLKVRAEKQAREYPGVQRVYNEIMIGAPTSNLTQSSDVWITTKVKSTMLATKGLKSSQIKVVTENGVVYLMGYVNKSQAGMAVNIARSTSGVQRVVKVFQYVK